MEREILDLCSRFGQLPSAQVILETQTDGHLVFHHFEGRSFHDFRGCAGLCCLYSPEYDIRLMFVSGSGDLSKPRVLPRIRRLAALLGYKLYIAPTHYEIPEEEKGGWMEDPEEDIQRQWRHWLLMDIHHTNELLFCHPDCRPLGKDPGWGLNFR